MQEPSCPAGSNCRLAVSMRAFHVDENGNIYQPQKLQAWNESVTLLINQEPDYLDALDAIW